MNSFLEIALSYAARGWFVHPLAAGKKKPITQNGKNDATTDEERIRDWWGQVPDANIGISCGPSSLCVLDVDHGLDTLEAFHAWRRRNGLPETVVDHEAGRKGGIILRGNINPIGVLSTWIGVTN
jgi:hypothetical protein